MLREDVVEAVDGGLFSVYAIEDVDDALSILTGRDAGARDEHGKFPEGSVNGCVENRLSKYAELRQAYAASSEANDDNDDKE